jgi:fused signal recognition particle receptor
LAQLGRKLILKSRPNPYFKGGDCLSIFSKIASGLKKTRDGMAGAIDRLVKSFTKIDEDFFDELEEILLVSDVSVSTAQSIRKALEAKVKETGEKEPEKIRVLLTEIITGMLSGGEELCLQTKPSVVLVIGVNGAGKTTTIGKLSASFKAQGKKVLLGAADTFRAAAIEQLDVWANRAGVDIIKHTEGSDPAAVVFDACEAGKARGADIIICDTAGRLHNKKNLMDELSKISRIIERQLPQASKEVLLVLDATTGQNAVNQAREFSKVADITGIVLTKLDGTAKGGIVISIRQELKLPVKFVGVGEKIDDLQPFNAGDFARALFGSVEN